MSFFLLFASDVDDGWVKMNHRSNEHRDKTDQDTLGSCEKACDEREDCIAMNFEEGSCTLYQRDDTGTTVLKGIPG